MIVDSKQKACVTCRKWGGNRRPANPTLTNVEYNSPNEKGTCYGGVHNLAQTPPLTYCDKWEPQYRK